MQNIDKAGTAVGTALARIVMQMKDLEGVEFRDDMAIVTELGFASIEVVTLIERIKSEFGVAFGEDPDDLNALRQFASLVAWIEERQPQ
jgi:acyl carrier protein